MTPHLLRNNIASIPAIAIAAIAVAMYLALPAKGQDTLSTLEPKDSLELPGTEGNRLNINAENKPFFDLLRDSARTLDILVSAEILALGGSRYEFFQTTIDLHAKDIDFSDLIRRIELKTRGFRSSLDGNAKVLNIIDNKLANTENPFDSPISGFSFRGTAFDFIGKLTEKADPRIELSGMFVIGTIDFESVIEFTVPDDSTLREALNAFARASGAGWFGFVIDIGELDESGQATSFQVDVSF